MAEPTSYEGRPLTDPNELIVDQGLQFDVGTLMKRRGLLHMVIVGAGSVALAACSPSASSSPSAGGSSSGIAATEASSAAAGGGSSISGITEIPEETAGPYPGDGSNGADVLEQSGVVRSDIRSSFGTSTTTAEGVPMTLELQIVDMANGNVPFEGVAVYVWHCTRDGAYSMYSEGLENENFLRGVQIADADGMVRFTSIFPGCYAGRWPHIHFEVYPDETSIVDATNKIATSQVALPQDTCETVYADSGYGDSAKNLGDITLATDNVFGEDEGESQMGETTGDVANGYTVFLRVGVDTTTEAGQGGDAPMPGSDGQPNGAPDGAPPSGGPGGEPPSGPPPSQ